MVVILFYETDWNDSLSVLAYLAASLRTGKPARFVHVAVGYVLDDLLLKTRSLHNTGVHCVKYRGDDKSLDNVTFVECPDVGATSVILTSQVIANTKLRITWFDAIKFLFGKGHSNNCITFAMNVTGDEPQNITADDLYARLKGNPQTEYESKDYK